MHRVHYIDKTPTQLINEGKTPDEVEQYQHELLKEGKSLWGYTTFAHLYGKPYTPIPTVVAPKPKTTEPASQKRDLQELSRLTGIPVQSVMGVLSSISPLLYIVANYTYVMELTDEETATRMGITPSRVRSHLSKVVPAMQRVWEKKNSSYVKRMLIGWNLPENYNLTPYIENLSKVQREVFTSYRVEGESLDTVATRMNMSKVQVQSSAANAVTRLKGMLRQEGVIS